MNLDLTQKTNSGVKSLSDKEIIEVYKFINKLKADEKEQITRSPMLIEKYRDTIWRTLGQRNADQLLDVANKDQESKIESAEKLLKTLAINIVAQYRVAINKEKYLTMVKECKYVCILDSSYLFQAGAYSPLLSTIEAANYIVPEMVIIMLWDQNMTLFPELFEKITDQARNMIVCDTTSRPLLVTKKWRETFKQVTFDRILREKSIETRRRELIIKTNMLVGMEIEHGQDVGNQLRINPYISLWGRYYEKNESKELIVSALSLKKRISNYIVYHARSGAYKFESKHRDGKGLNQRKKFVNYIINKGLHIFVLGAVDEKDKEISEDITYINEINNKDSSFQLHLLHGSELIIGNPSGMTHLATVVSTPLLMIDSPWPFVYPAPKEREYKIIMRKLDGENSCISKYFEYDPMEYYKMACHLPHVLEKRGLRIYPSSDNSLIKGTEEILYKKEAQKKEKKEIYSKIKRTILENIEERYGYIRHLQSLQVD